MKPRVYFANLRARSHEESKVEKIKKLFDRAEFKDIISKNDLTAVKVHFGEKGNDGFVSPVFVRQVVDKIKESGGKPFVTDTNTLYLGSRHNAVDHLITAIEHGFDYSVVGAPVIISDGLTSQNIVEVEVNAKHFQNVKIASDISKSNGMMVISHFKGHPLAGFGGAVKNLAMGCAPSEGKKDQHSPRPEIKTDVCATCGKCIEVCPADAIKIVENTSIIEKEICIGCFECASACSLNAIEINWDTEIVPFMERMTEYAYGAVKGKENKCGYVNFLMNITPDCDCFGFSDAPIVPDIGILASKDPVALDKASYDLVNQSVGIQGTQLKENLESGCDKFKGLRHNTEGYIQISYAEELGMGSADYELVEI